MSNAAGTAQWSEGDAFSGVQSGLYWSSSSLAFIPRNAWSVYLYGGYVVYDSKEYSLLVWPVRAGQ